MKRIAVCLLILTFAVISAGCGGDGGAKPPATGPTGGAPTEPDKGGMPAPPPLPPPPP